LHEKEIEAGLIDKPSATRASLRDLKSFTDEFEMIDSIVADQIKIAKKIIQ